MGDSKKKRVRDSSRGKEKEPRQRASMRIHKMKESICLYSDTYGEEQRKKNQETNNKIK